MARRNLARLAEPLRHPFPMEALVRLPFRVRAESPLALGRFAQNLRRGAYGKVGEEEAIGYRIWGRWARLAADLMVAGGQCVACAVKGARDEDLVVLRLFLRPAVADAADGVHLRLIVRREGHVRPPWQESDMVLPERGENVADSLPAAYHEKLVRIEGEDPIPLHILHCQFVHEIRQRRCLAMKWRWILSDVDGKSRACECPEGIERAIFTVIVDDDHSFHERGVVANECLDDVGFITHPADDHHFHATREDASSAISQITLG